MALLRSGTGKRKDVDPALWVLDPGYTPFRMRCVYTFLRMGQRAARANGQRRRHWWPAKS